MAGTVAVDVDAHIARVTLNRPDKMNAINVDMFVELGELGQQISADRSIRAVVLSGAGDNFCAGIDTSIFGSEGARHGSRFNGATVAVTGQYVSAGSLRLA